MTRSYDQADLIAAFDESMCPDCGGGQIIPGPRGGLSQNVHCAGCGSRFNVAKWQGRVFFVERLDHDPPAGVQ